MSGKNSGGAGLKKRHRVLKGVLITLAVIVILIAAAAAYVILNLNSVVKTAIERYGSEATQTAVRVEKVDLKLLKGFCGIGGLTVANPPGFGMEHCFSLGEVRADLDLASLAGDAVRIEEITVRSLKVFIEVNKDNRNNLNELRKNLPEPAAETAGAEADPDTAAAGRAPRLRIDHILFEGGNISALIVPLKDKTYSLDMPTIELKNLQGTPDQITSQIIRKLSKQAEAELKKQGIDYLQEKYGDQAEKKVKKEAKKLEKELKERLKL
ncbi:AsmA family protein [bacterium]|nr:AsmA family protein [bacterium]